MKVLLLVTFLTFSAIAVYAQKTPYELSNKTETATYSQVMSYYTALDKKYDQMKLFTGGQTDIGEPLHLVVLSRNKIFDAATLKKQGKRILFINNGIHPGEPEGIDATMMLTRDLLEGNKLPDNLVICIVPVYNIDGCLNRGLSRVNQNGPVSYGFRGNYQNLDLNRDFIKTDSKNSLSFQALFNAWKPEIFIDNHTSNGSDYQYIMTLIPTQKDKLNPILSGYMTGTLVPYLYDKMKSSGFELTPYVNSVGETPESGITGFLETQRYSTGYAALHNCIGFMPETHMLKSFDKRVQGTYTFMEHMIAVVKRDAALIGENKRRADEQVSTQTTFPLNWKLDRNTVTEFSFKGFEAKHKPSDVSGLQRLYYDRNSPFERKIKVWDHFEPALSVEKPLAYVIPQSWEKVIRLLKLNGIALKRLTATTAIDADMYLVGDYKTAARPFEGHYTHNGLQLTTTKQRVTFYKGDYVVMVNQPGNRYIVECLEPQGGDSYFTWNFFDPILGRKEHYSDYVFEDVAAALLKSDAALRQKLEDEKAKNPALANSADAQLEFIYQNSVYSEKTAMRYPVGRLASVAGLNLY
ncbi:M14 family metallopeptidase [Hufsiella ginkgonis]|uniref:Peptidase M14 domain-containing protein n=1 Tax=Hufsiella ginkgonis TaxID=2695274 RepID=A0A7K1XVP1_9SPHI|nr:M14 family metallopeptidase [Hufsiella ginkgonis]MXV14878.1 hypothetical protein [Hufsiella ginkgonis]